MPIKSRLDFILHLTDYFHGHWEDPEWGKRPHDQILIMTAIHELANRIADQTVRQHVQAPLEKGVAQSAQQMMRDAA